MFKNRHIKTFGLIVASGLLGACGNSLTCEPLESLETVQERDAIAVPGDLDGLDPTRALRIPVATTPPRDDKTECLDRPPRLEEAGV